MSWSRTLGVALVLAVVAGAFAGDAGRRADVGHAAGVTVSSEPLSTFRPADLPPVCSSHTLTATADTWVNENKADANTAYGSATQLLVTARTNRNAWALVQFTLPAAPAGCTLTSATLTLNNTPTTGSTGRTIQAYRASAAWSESTVTWTTKPTYVTGTVAQATSAAGSMQWTVTGHVESMYSGSNFGFILKDSVDNAGTTAYTQQFDSRDQPIKPTLVLQWG